MKHVSFSSKMKSIASVQMDWLVVTSNKLEVRYPRFSEVFSDIPEYQETLDQWNLLFDKLDCYDSCETLIIETDFTYEIPSNVKKFTKLKSVSIEGARFWDMKLDTLPTTIESLNVSEQSNCPSDFYYDIHQKLPVLQRLVIDENQIKFDLYNCENQLPDEQINVQPLPYLPTLQVIDVVSFTGTDPDPEFLMAYLKKHPFFLNYIDKIASVRYNKKERGSDTISVYMG